MFSINFVLNKVRKFLRKGLAIFLIKLFFNILKNNLIDKQKLSKWK